MTRTKEKEVKGESTGIEKTAAPNIAPNSKATYVMPQEEAKRIEKAIMHERRTTLLRKGSSSADNVDLHPLEQ